ncbi:sulfurtransferase [Candidatus Marsarchaeota G2 archaeon ECH_B_SAG-G06]|uniref:Sulfurtransferase n=1 Tax=Candidatus Marsarchaeota G2 archaeon ECH_B_SAG-G06 TaxID=1978166 RepID=A0A2R6BZS5_9ARCH|nr:MAG: sulfurtransferase [Candidatus Marsarchaeota G2 archaeon ECH_B_SAG-G06]
MPSNYAHPEVLVETQWVQDHLNDPTVRIVEVDYDPVPNYNQGHIPGAVLWDWRKDLNDPVVRDILSAKQLEELLERSGISEGMTTVLYGDFNNWFAAYAFWDLTYYGVKNVKLMNGGRKAWLLEERPLTKEVPNYPRGNYKIKGEPDETIRAYIDYVRRAIRMKDKVLVDVRSPKEYTGEITAPPEYPNEAAQRGGHISGAINIPWALAVNDADGRFKSREELEALYRSKGVTPEKEVITYCRIGERSSHTWFVLKYLLGYPNVKNYDASWTEWGNTVKNPIEK